MNNIMCPPYYEETYCGKHVHDKGLPPVGVRWQVDIAVAVVLTAGVHRRYILGVQ